MNNNPIKKEKAVDLIKKLTFELEYSKPSKEKMIEDLKMMNFKIRSLFGDIAVLANCQNSFLEALWKIGKLEETVAEGINILDEEEKKIFFNLIENIKDRVQKKIYLQVNHSFSESRETSVLEIEILKERKRKNNLN